MHAHVLSATARAVATADRLDSWKEIAAHLRRTVRTVQRWERLYGLPVRRHAHSAGSSVYAFASDLDRWWIERAPHGLERGEQDRAVDRGHKPVAVERVAQLTGMDVRVQVVITAIPGRSPLALPADTLHRALTTASESVVNRLQLTLGHIARA